MVSTVNDRDVANSIGLHYNNVPMIFFLNKNRIRQILLREKKEVAYGPPVYVILTYYLAKNIRV